MLAVVAFHAGLGRMVGGFLGVSTFFTLSGFLVTGLLVRRSRHSPAIALRPFWERRARRLLPASLATLAGIVLLFGPFVATAEQRRAMPADVLAALFEVANWHDIASGSSYGALFAAPSPVLHFWSLSIEAQFYVVLPLLVLAAWRCGHRRRPALAAILGGLALLSALEPVVFSMSPDRVYYGTDTRAVELLIGGLLGLAWTHEPIRRRLVIGRGVRVTVPALGALALGLQLWWWWSLPLSTPWLSRGGFTGYAVLSCLVILAAAVRAVRNPDPEKVSAYECGFNAFDDARMKFDVRFYLVSILFIIFDLEVAFLFPWATIFKEIVATPEVKLFGFAEMLIFIGVLVIGYIYAWVKGALDWE